VAERLAGGDSGAAPFRAAWAAAQGRAVDPLRWALLVALRGAAALFYGRVYVFTGILRIRCVYFVPAKPAVAFADVVPCCYICIMLR